MLHKCSNLYIRSTLTEDGVLWAQRRGNKMETKKQIHTNNNGILIMNMCVDTYMSVSRNGGSAWEHPFRPGLVGRLGHATVCI